MNKIKEVIDKISTDYKDYFKKYFITNIGLILFTLYLMITNYSSFADSLVIRIAVMLICTNFLIESAFKYKDKKRVYLYLLTIGLSVIIGLIIPVENKIAINMYIGLNLISIVIGLFLIIRKEKNIPKYVCKVFYNLFKVELFTTVLLIGFGIIYIIAESLLLEGYSIDFYSKIFFLIFGIYNIPFTIMALLYTKDDIPDVVNTLINRVLLVLLDVSYIVIIIYILKILITRVVPENEVFAIVTLLFTFSLPMFIMLSNYNGKLEKFNYKYLPYVLICPIILQIYSIFTRINTYGVTESRYIGVYIIIFEIISLFLLLFKNKKYIIYDFIIMAIMFLFLFMLPITNIYEAPIGLQVKRLESIWPETKDETKLTKSDRQKIKDIYDYLNEYDEIDKYMPSYLKMEKINRYLMNTRGEFEGIQARYFTFVSSEVKIDITDYKNMESIRYNGNRVSIDNLNITVDNAIFNMSEYIRDYIKNEDDIKQMIIDNGNGSILYITKLEFYYNDNDNSLENFIIEGYLLGM
jgi:hypothetical protein